MRQVVRSYRERWMKGGESQNYLLFGKEDRVPDLGIAHCGEHGKASDEWGRLMKLVTVLERRAA